MARYTGLEFIGCEQTHADGGAEASTTTTKVAAAASSSASSFSAYSGGCTVVVSYDRLSNGNEGPDPPGPHGPVDAAFTMRVTVRPAVKLL